jgi:catecholate siderophore receptor
MTKNAKRKRHAAHAGLRRLQISETTLGVVNAIMLAGAAAHAQNTNAPAATPAGTNAPTRLREVVVSGQQDSYKPEAVASPRLTEPLRDIPQTITVIPQAVMQEQNATTLRDVLRNTPGISIQAGEGGVPAGDNLSIRGFTARTDIFVDGVRDIGGYSRDPFNLEQVEVFKGPTSSLGGRGSTGGSINLVTKTPRVSPFYAGAFGVGTDAYKRATVDVNQPLSELGMKDVAIRLNGMWHDADTPGRDEVTNERWGVAPSIAFGLGTPTKVTLSYLHLDQDNMPDYGIPWVPAGNIDPVLSNYIDQAPPVDYSNFYGLTARDYEKIRTDIATAEVKHDFSDALSLRNLTRYGRTDRDSIITAPRFVDEDPGTPGNQFGRTIRRTDWKDRDQVDDLWANLTDVRFDFETGPVEHALASGIEFAREKEIRHLKSATGPASPNTDVFDPNPDDPYTDAIRHDGRRNEARADSFAIYAFDTLKLTEKWQVTGGLRWDYFDVDYETRAANGAVTELSRSDRMLSWRGGLIFKPQPNGSIYFGYGTSFNPSAEGLTLTDAVEGLEPEESRSYELGTKWDFFKERASVTMALFRTEKTNARTPGVDPNDPPQILDGVQTVQGIELGLAGSITEDWKVFGGYAFMDSEIEESNNANELGNALANTPEHTFSLWTTYRLPFGIEVGGGAQYVGDRFNNNTGLRAAPDYWVFDAMAAYRLNEHFTLRLNVYNLADEQYIDRVGGGHFIPGAGRSAVVTANMYF